VTSLLKFYSCCCFLYFLLLNLIFYFVLGNIWLSVVNKKRLTSLFDAKRSKEIHTCFKIWCFLFVHWFSTLKQVLRNHPLSQQNTYILLLIWFTRIDSSEQCWCWCCKILAGTRLIEVSIQWRFMHYNFVYQPTEQHNVTVEID
jgi:hypothetical protein